VIGRALVVRTDGMGDVLLSGPAVRAIARRYDVTYLAGPTGAAAARLLPGVSDVIEFDTPWIAADPPPVDGRSLTHLVDRCRAGRFDVAAILTSARQSALPTALILRLVGVSRIAAISRDYPGSLLDVRIPGDPDVHEARRALLVAEALDCPLASEDTGALAVRHPQPPTHISDLAPFVVVHPGSSVPARSLSANVWTAVVSELIDAGHRVVVTGGSNETHLHDVAETSGAIDLVGRTDLATLASVLRCADVVCVGNTGATHLSAAVGTPIVAAFPPTVPLLRWRPWMVPHVVLGDTSIECRECYAKTCPKNGQPCLATVAPDQVVAAVDHLRSVHRDRPATVVQPTVLQPSAPQPFVLLPRTVAT